MVTSATADDRVFFEPTPAWSSFPGVEDLGFRSGNRLDELVSRGGDAGKSLHEVQRDSFAGQDGASRSRDSHDYAALGQCRSIVGALRDFDADGKLLESGMGQNASCQDEGFSGDHVRPDEGR